MLNDDIFPTSQFPLGRLRVSPGVGELCIHVDPSLDLFALLRSHASGDWGDIDEFDRWVNEEGLRSRGQQTRRLLSRYMVMLRGRVVPTMLYVLTEWDRSATTIFTPEEYAG